ncbi:tRNA dihydrouridine(20/20a) synthase DusA [Leptospira ognonensis]|uniref:tRNA-dihydrouridine(20/20a) synthase n=1 Tax=Leptospira ognonensis TaxID=2484945 RepID=A0A4R9K8S5_9LEPT|nr:tRNA dihydrouridine(20/20a) synthase DusA [Leptospira ognonensis]TGL63038.1 tRNA dihydrouridine(20/20a) synthase DusA [Leptospira ognonensis]
MENTVIPAYRMSIAPMMDWTDRHYRYFMRLLTKRTLLYTEMVTTGAILRNDRREQFLSYSPEELPLALQLGGDDPVALAECAQIGEDYGYSEINLNVGCPSDRVQSGSFGACLMREPNRVAEMVSSCKKATSLPVTVKHRIGIDGKDSLDDLLHFVHTIKDAGVDRIIIHARIAILEGLSPAENRKVPPLRYADVYEVKKQFPELPIIINGGILDFQSAHKHMLSVDAVMIGRAAYDNPYLFASADSEFYSEKDPGLSREDVLMELANYIARMDTLGTKVHHVMRHVLGLYHGRHGARAFRRFFSEKMHGSNVDSNLIQNFLKLKVV